MAKDLFAFIGDAEHRVVVHDGLDVMQRSLRLEAVVVR